MAIKKYEDLDAMHLDVLKEIGNIGSGNATTALSQMLNTVVEIEVPVVEILDFQQAIDAAGGPEKIVAGILVGIKGDISGMIMFLFEKELVSVITETFFGHQTENLVAIDEGERSALHEIGNIMAASYVNAISQLANMFIDVDVPNMAVDMLGAIMSAPASQMGQMGDKLLYIDNNIVLGKVNVRSKMLLLPTIDSLGNLLGKLGVL